MDLQLIENITKEQRNKLMNIWLQDDMNDIKENFQRMKIDNELRFKEIEDKIAKWEEKKKKAK